MPDTSSKRSTRTTALVIIAVVAVLVIALVLVLRGRDDDGSERDDQSVPVTSTTGGQVVESSPEIKAFCEQTKAIRDLARDVTNALEADPNAVLTNDAVADLVENFDGSSMDPDQMPEEVSDDVRYLIDHQADIARTLREADPTAPIDQVLSLDVLNRISRLLMANATACTS